ncbi:hypothetical protein UY3_11049 [Chelonia mydas]|uniref:Uncharacterized protein n=1 Tax=Chelonia mydas TaxID=8469 RepID=M7B1Z0_CHEMY|nr:hypothetical protein UY3_11049 [Chelonia mydas]
MVLLLLSCYAPGLTSLARTLEDLLCITDQQGSLQGIDISLAASLAALKILKDQCIVFITVSTILKSSAGSMFLTELVDTQGSAVYLRVN